MSAFAHIDGELYAERVPVAKIAEVVGTPCYLYSRAALVARYREYDEGFGKTPHLVCYSVKANSNLAVLRTLAKEGSGFDVVSGGELARVLRAGGDPRKVVFSGVGKQAAEVREALEAGILMFNVESPAEIDLIDSVARSLGRRAPVAMRVNPDVDPKTHPYISTGLRTSKFGIAMERCTEDYARAAQLPGLEIVGADCHIGSQLTSTEPFAEAVSRMSKLLDRLEEAGIRVRYLDVGGGLGISYDQEKPPEAGEYTKTLVRGIGGRNVTIITEPGRSIVGNSGILVTKVLFHKSTSEKNFVVVDAAMNDLMRPALYSAYHGVEAVAPSSGTIKADVVGPVCESGDFFAKDRIVPVVEPGGLLALMSAGAYGFSMASNYNTRPRAAEVLVDGDRFDVVRKRETIEDLLALESIPETLR